MSRQTTAQIVARAMENKTVVPAFNIPYLPMMEPVVRALRDTKSFGLVAVARLEWVKFHSKSPEAVYRQYQEVKDEAFTRLHMDHVPVIDEDQKQVDYMVDLSHAVQLGYDSVMVDGSRLDLDENIQATAKVVEMAHAGGAAVEGELGAVMGHEAGPMPAYEELFASGKGFTDPEQARRFVTESGVDWLSVAVGSFHGAISAKRHEKKPTARLNIEHLRKIHDATGIPLVLHGGTGIAKQYVMDAIRSGIAKINVATAIRQPYEAHLETSHEQALEGVYQATRKVIEEDLEIAGSASIVNPQS
jgi:fructose-bisphosphate aldolase class II